MKLHTLAAFSIFAAVFAVGAAAQRHDEKPHAVMKAPEKNEQTRSAGTGGRHDEGPTSHGKKRPAKKKEQQKAVTDETTK